MKAKEEGKDKFKPARSQGMEVRYWHVHLVPQHTYNNEVLEEARLIESRCLAALWREVLIATNH